MYMTNPTRGSSFVFKKVTALQLGMLYCFALLFVWPCLLSSFSISRLHVCMHHPLSFEEEVYSGWTGQVDEVATTNLEKSLLLRDTDSGLIAVNFDPKACITI